MRVEKTGEYRDWIDNLKDLSGRARILMRAVAEVLAGAVRTQAESDIAERFTGRGPWKRHLPQILRTLEALGRARRDGERWRA